MPGGCCFKSKGCASMDFSFLDQLNVTAYVTDMQLKLLYVNQTAARRHKQARDLIGQSILDCHKREDAREKIKQMAGEFARGRKEPYNYSLKKGSKVLHKVILPYYHEDVIAGLIELMYFV